MSAASEPLDFIKQSLDEQVFIKLRGCREIIGKLHGYDSHCNMVIGDAVETIYYVDENTKEATTRQETSKLVFVRGDAVIFVTDPANA